MKKLMAALLICLMISCCGCTVWTNVQPVPSSTLVTDEPPALDEPGIYANQSYQYDFIFRGTVQAIREYKIDAWGDDEPQYATVIKFSVEDELYSEFPKPKKTVTAVHIGNSLTRLGLEYELVTDESYYVVSHIFTLRDESGDDAELGLYRKGDVAMRPMYYYVMPIKDGKVWVSEEYSFAKFAGPIRFLAHRSDFSLVEMDQEEFEADFREMISLYKGY